MTRVLSMKGPPCEVLKHLHAEAVALLGMKLRSEYVLVSHGGREGSAVGALGRDVRRIVADDVIRVHEVEARFVTDEIRKEHFVFAGGVVPAHMRDLERAIDGRELSRGRRDEAEP